MVVWVKNMGYGCFECNGYLKGSCSDERGRSWMGCGNVEGGIFVCGIIGVLKGSLGGC